MPPVRLRRPITNGSVHFLPRLRTTPDPIAEMLPDLDCSAPGGAPDGKGLVRFAHNVAAQQRLALAQRLIDYALDAFNGNGVAHLEHQLTGRRRRRPRASTAASRGSPSATRA